MFRNIDTEVLEYIYKNTEDQTIHLKLLAQYPELGRLQDVKHTDLEQEFIETVKDLERAPSEQLFSALLELLTTNDISSAYRYHQCKYKFSSNMIKRVMSTINFSNVHEVDFWIDSIFKQSIFNMKPSEREHLYESQEYLDFVKRYGVRFLKGRLPRTLQEYILNTNFNLMHCDKFCLDRDIQLKMLHYCLYGNTDYYDDMDIEDCKETFTMIKNPIISQSMFNKLIRVLCEDKNSYKDTVMQLVGEDKLSYDVGMVLTNSNIGDAVLSTV